MTPPLIGITLDIEKFGGYSKFPWYALRENYPAAVSRAGGLPIMLPHDVDQFAPYLDLISGLLVTGGAFDIDPALFGSKSQHPSVTTKSNRTKFEWAITEAALDRDIPVLGICGGQQLLNVILGGTLIQHIPDEVPEALPHEQPNPRDEPGHDITICKDTLLQRITGMDRMSVNSAHHQAVKSVGNDVVINAYAEDGVIEGIEAKNYRFCIGIQWHPEFLIDPGDSRIFKTFVSEAGKD